MKPQTVALHAGFNPEFTENSARPPEFKCSTFLFKSAEEGELFFKRAYHLPGDDGLSPGLVYSRLGNPDVDMFEDKMTSIEPRAEWGVAFPSGMNAITTAILALVGTGKRVLYTSPVYGGTYLFFKDFCPGRFGITTKAINMNRLAEVAEVWANERPFDMVFIETPANPTLTLVDIAGVRDIIGPETLMMVDNTLLGPIFQAPLLLGADIVIYSATKYIGGHSDVIAGITLGAKKEHEKPLRGYRTIMGGTMDAGAACRLLKSMETLVIRMKSHVFNAQQVADYLQQRPEVDKVLFPGLLTPADVPCHDIYTRQCSGPGGLFSFTFKEGGKARAFAFLNNLKLAYLAVSLGSTHTLVEHPRTMTHSDMTIEDLDRCGIGDNMIRVAIGLEHPDDLIKDFGDAIDLAVANTRNPMVETSVG